MVSQKTLAIIGILISLATLIGTAKFNWNLFQFYPFQVLDVSECNYILEPRWGRIECEPVTHVWQTSTELEIAGDYFLKCGDNENSPACRLYAKLQKNLACWGSRDSGYRFCYQYLNPKGEVKCRELTCDEVNRGEWVEILSDQEYRLGTFIKVWFEEGYWPFNEKVSGWVKETYLPYGLVVKEGGKWRYKTDSCDIGEVLNKELVCLEGDCDQPLKTRIIAFDSWVNYLAGWTQVPPDFAKRVVTYNGRPYYCQPSVGGGELYELESAKLSDGKTYCWPGKWSGIHVECCPGMITFDKYCGEDLRWHPIEEFEGRECDSDLDCGDNGIIERKDVYPYVVERYACINGKCVKVEEKEVECLPPNLGCPEGYLCAPEKGYKCIKQVGPAIKCGDGICTRPYENEFNCPQDCLKEPEVGKIDMSLLAIVIMVVLGGLVAYARTRDVVWGIVGAIAGFIAGYIIYWILSLPWWVKLLGGIGLAAGGGLILYFFGGTILMLLMFLLSRR